MFVPRYYDGSPQVTIRLTPEIMGWVNTQGGRKFIRQAIMLEYNKKERELRDFLVDFGNHSSTEKVNVRLNPAVHEFIIRAGGGPFVRDLLYRYMITAKKARKRQESQV